MNANNLQQVLTEHDYKTGTWVGGTSKQLFIYPPGGSYPDRNFKFRLSIATTSNEESTFTKLQGVDRVISVLEGKMEINHQGHHSALLHPYEIDRFKGQWHTTSKGKVTDFNLMMKGCHGDFSFAPIKQQMQIYFDHSPGAKIVFTYCIQGQLKCNNRALSSGQLLVQQSDHLIVEPQGQGQAKIFYGFVNVSQSQS